MFSACLQLACFLCMLIAQDSFCFRANVFVVIVVVVVVGCVCVGRRGAISAFLSTWRGTVGFGCIGVWQLTLGCGGQVLCTMP